MATKWDYIVDENDRRELDATPLDVNCSGCGEHLASEGAFARHFVLYTAEYKNLGYCPVKGPNGGIATEEVVEAYGWEDESGVRFSAGLIVPPFMDEARCWRIVYTPKGSSEHVEWVTIPVDMSPAAVLNQWAERDVIPRQS